jgi:CubicO group peptidase (beta-lactamase class C family)
MAFFASGCNSLSQQTHSPKEDTLRKVSFNNTGKLSGKEYTFYHDVLKKYFDSRLLQKGFNGGILVAKNGVIVYEEYQGFRDLRLKDSLTAKTPMHIASASKTFTGMAVLQLIQQGKLALKDTLGKFFPGFPYPGITVKNLLSHRSGLPNYIHYFDALKWDKSKMVTNQDVLNSLFTYKPNKESQPDRRFSYSNTNYILLALIIEKITGQLYPAYMKKQIFDSLTMTDTWVATPADTAKLTPSFNWRGRYWQPDFLDQTYGDKNIYTTPRDLLKWDVAVTTGQIIGQPLLDSAYTPYSNERPSVHNYGLGWRLLMLKNGKKIIYHNGRWHGTNVAFARLPNEKATIIIIGNKFNTNIYSSAKKAYDIFGEYMQQQSADEDEERLTKQESPARQGSANETYAGVSAAEIIPSIKK